MWIQYDNVTCEYKMKDTRTEFKPNQTKPYKRREMFKPKVVGQIDIFPTHDEHHYHHNKDLIINTQLSNLLVTTVSA